MRTMIVKLAAAVATLAAAAAPAQAQSPAAIEQLKATVEEAYLYGLPMVVGYSVIHQFFLDPKSGQFKAPINQLHNEARVFTPKDTGISTPNSDTPYSMVFLDLRAEPMVLCMPNIDKARYYDVQLVDLYSNNYGYMGSRTTGNGDGCYMVAGPDWQGQTPDAIKKAFRSETQFSLVVYRTQLFDAADMDNVKKVQAGYIVQPLSAFTGSPTPPPAPKIDWLPFKPEAFTTDFVEYLNFLLQFAPATGTAAVEKPMRERFAKIGIGPGLKPSGAHATPQMKAGDGRGHQGRAGQGQPHCRNRRQGRQRLAHRLGRRQPRVLQRQLGAARGRRQARHLRQQPGRGRLPLHQARRQRHRRRRQQAHLPDHLRGRAAAAGERLLVDHDVRRAHAAADRQPDQPLPDQLADAAGSEEERRRLDHDLRAEGLAGQGQGVELAARAGRPDVPGHAAVLAEDRGAVGVPAGRRRMEAAGAGAGAQPERAGREALRRQVGGEHRAHRHALRPRRAVPGPARLGLLEPPGIPAADPEPEPVAGHAVDLLHRAAGDAGRGHADAELQLPARALLPVRAVQAGGRHLRVDRRGPGRPADRTRPGFDQSVPRRRQPARPTSATSRCTCVAEDAPTDKAQRAVQHAVRRQRRRRADVREPHLPGRPGQRRRRLGPGRFTHARPGAARPTAARWPTAPS